MDRNLLLSCQELALDQASPWENGYNKSFNGKLRDAARNHEILYTLTEARVIIEGWKKITILSDPTAL
jgi:hypothetical protein